MEEETVAVLALPNEYAYYIGQVASVSTDTLKMVRKQFSIKTPYTLKAVPVSKVARVEYKTGLVPLRIVAGLLLLALLGGIAYYICMGSLEDGTRIRVGLLCLAGVYGCRWAFMSRRHKFIFHLRDGSRIGWHSRSGDFKCKQRAVSLLQEYLRGRGLLAKTDQ